MPHRQSSPLPQDQPVPSNDAPPELQGTEKWGEPSDRRAHARFRVPMDFCFQLQWTHMGIATLSTESWPLDISASGIGILGTVPIPIGARCACGLRARDGQRHSLSGTVVACEEIAAGVFHIGISLDQQIEVEPFIGTNVRSAPGDPWPFDHNDHEETSRRVEYVRLRASLNRDVA